MKNLKKIGFTAAALLAAFCATFPAFAAVPAGVTTAISDAVADVGTIGAAVLLVIIAIAAFVWLRRAIH